MKQHTASFYDPCGHVFTEDGELYRSISSSYFPQFEHLEKSGLLEELVEKGLLVSHTTILKDAEKIVIKPQFIPLISYPRNGLLRPFERPPCFTSRSTNWPLSAK